MLRQSFDEIPALAWSASPEGRVEFANRQWHEFTGIAEDNLTGENWTSAFHQDDIDKVIEKWTELIATQRAGEIEARMRRHDGTVRTFLIRAAPLRDESGRVVRWFGSNSDIDDLKRIEEMQESLARAGRLTAMGELTVSIAHEVNQPLMAIVTNAATCLQWLAPGQVDPDKARQMAERIVRDGHRAGDIIASIRALARKSPPALGPLDLNEAIAEVLLLARGELHRQGISVVTDLAGKATVLGDRVQMQQVVLNLIVNAVEAVAATRQPTRRITIRTAAADAVEIVVSVADTGVGFNPANSSRIFEAFFTTKPEGIGIGLSICRSIVEAHGGRLWAEPNTPEGALVCFTVPIFTNDDTQAARG